MSTTAQLGPVLFVQNATHRAGAQTCLVRLLSQDLMQSWQPVVLCSSPGWLTEECQRRGIKFLVVPFPRSRSLIARLRKNSLFVRTVQSKLRTLAIQPNIVHANDHWEGILASHLADVLSARSMIFLRSSRMTREDYFKYWCDRFMHVLAVGPTLQARARSWSPSQSIEMVYDGVEQNEFFSPIPKAKNAPNRLLVIGAERSSKGWADMVEALRILQERGAQIPEQIDFTGDKPSKRENDLQLSRVTGVQFNFLGRTTAFADLVRKYDLVVNPSRSDSFGMAAIETLAAGAPLLTSRTGVLEEVVSVDHMLFPPAQPSLLADAIERVLSNWHRLDLGVAQAQEAIRQKFSIARCAAIVDGLYRCPAPPPVSL